MNHDDLRIAKLSRDLRYCHRIGGGYLAKAITIALLIDEAAGDLGRDRPIAPFDFFVPAG